MDFDDKEALESVDKTSEEKNIDYNFIHSREWTEKNYHLFGNAKGSKFNEVFFSLGKYHMGLTYVYPKNVVKAPIGGVVEFKYNPERFNREMNELSSYLFKLKRENKEK